MQTLHRDDLPRGGFAGLHEHRLVMDPQAFGRRVDPGTWPGIGHFVYLADARFRPKGETGMHGHKEVDVISVMVEGRISHAGSLEHGQGLTDGDVQIQRAGGEGFSHNEINPDDRENRMIQLWVLPERPGQPAAYKLYRPNWGEVRRIYGGNDNDGNTFTSNTVVEFARLERGQNLACVGPMLAYLTTGRGIANGAGVSEGDLFKDADLRFDATEDAQLIVIRLLQQSIAG